MEKRWLRVVLALIIAAALKVAAAHAEQEFFEQNYASTGLLDEQPAERVPTFDAALSAEQAAAEKLLYSPTIKQTRTTTTPAAPLPGYPGRFTRRQAGVEPRTVPNDQGTVVVDR